MSADRSLLIQSDNATPCATSPALSCQLFSSSFICFKSAPLADLSIYLQMLAKHKPPVSGKIDYQPDLKLAYIDENIQLLSILPGLNNLKLAAEYHQLGTSQQIEERAEHLLTRFNCRHIRLQLPAFMNALEKRLMLIARALMLQPDILFIEKPFQGLNMYEHNILGEHLMAVVNDLKITVISGYTTLAFMKKADPQILYCDNQVFYVYNNWDSFKQSHTELFDY